MENLFNGQRTFVPMSMVLNRLAAAIHVQALPPIASSFLLLHLEALASHSNQMGYVDVAQSTSWNIATLIDLDFPRLGIWRARQRLSAIDLVLEKKHPTGDSFILVFSPKFIECLKEDLPSHKASRASKPRQRASHRLANMLFGSNYSDAGYNWFDGNHAIKEVKKVVKAKELTELAKWRKQFRRDPLPVSDVAVFDELKVFRSHRSRKQEDDAKPEDSSSGAIILNISERLRNARNQSRD